MSIETSTPAPTKMVAIKTGGGITRWVPEANRPKPAPAFAAPAASPILRHEIGETLRRLRQADGRTLRDISGEAMVSLGYISEVERGKKEVSSEMLSAICGALNVSLAAVLLEVAGRIQLAEGIEVPDTVPDSMTREVLQQA